MGLVDDQVRGLFGLLEHESRCARVVGVLGDEAFAFLVHDHSRQQNFGRIGRRGDELFVHVLGDAARRNAHPQTQAVVVGVTQDVGRHQPMVFGAPRLPQRGGVLGDHLRVHRKSACGDDDRFTFDRTGFGEVFPGDAGHGSVAVQDQVGCPGLVSDLHTQFVGAFD